jgi:hypothetical protein
MAMFFRLSLPVLLLGTGMAAAALAQDAPPGAPADPDTATDEQPGAVEPGADQGSEQRGEPEQPGADEPAAEESPAVEEPAAQPDESGAAADDIILDPELEGIPPASGADPQSAPASDREDYTGIVRMVLRSRFGVDVEWDDPREEVWEATQMALFEATVRRSENLRFMVGLRGRHQFSAMQKDTAETPSERVLLDAAPTAGYADATLTDGLHLRAGYQIVRMGRFDVFSATNFLDGLDMRNGPATMPEAAEFAQPALRLDWDAQQWLSLKAVYLPFFQPHIVELSDSDYALMPLNQASMGNIATGIIGPEGDELSDYVRELMIDHLPRSARSRMNESSFSAFAPDPDLTDPQGALRITAHGPAGEVALTAGTALERLPAVAMTEENYELMSDLMRSGVVGQPPDLQVDDPLAMQIFYNRFYVFSLDGATDVGPVQVGAEAAYLMDRTMYAVSEGAFPSPQYTDMLHLGLRAEYVGGTEWLATLEGFFAYSLYLPAYDDQEWMFMEQNRFMSGGALHLAWSPSDWGWTFEASGALLNGPSYLVAPRIEARLVAELYAEVGAFFVGGPSSSSGFGGPETTLGGIYDDVDQVFVGLRWLP